MVLVRSERAKRKKQSTVGSKGKERRERNQLGPLLGIWWNTEERGC